MTIDLDSMSDVDRGVYEWIDTHIEGEIRRFDRQPRWRAGWDVVVHRDGVDQAIYVRGARPPNQAQPLTLHQEAIIHRVFERHGIPAPRLFGVIDEPLALVMERLPGRINTQTVEDPQVRRRILDDFIAIVARVHQIPLEEFEPLGLTVPRGPQELAHALFAPAEAIFRKSVTRPVPLAEFIAGWLKRNVPTNRHEAVFVNTDAGQFLFEGDRVTGLIDFETSAIGDPAAEIAGMRLRDTTEPLGDFSTLVARYQQLTGDRLGKSLIEYYTAVFCGVNGFLMWPMLLDPKPDQDYVAYMNFCIATSRWAIRAIAESLGLQLETPPEPVSRPLGYDATGPQLVASIESLKADTAVDTYAREKTAALARYLQRWNEFGRDILARDLDDVSALLERQFVEWADAQSALNQWLVTRGGADDRRLAQYFHNWLCRQDFLLRGCGQASYLVGMELQTISESA